MVFQQSRVKDTISTSGERSDPQNTKTKEVRNGEKARAFLLQPKYVRRNSSNSEQRKLQKSFDGKRFPTEGKKKLSQQKVKRPIAESSSEQEHKVNALASGADEGRDKLR